MLLIEETCTYPELAPKVSNRRKRYYYYKCKTSKRESTYVGVDAGGVAGRRSLAANQSSSANLLR